MGLKESKKAAINIASNSKEIYRGTKKQEDQWSNLEYLEDRHKRGQKGFKLKTDPQKTRIVQTVRRAEGLRTWYCGGPFDSIKTFQVSQVATATWANGLFCFMDRKMLINNTNMQGHLESSAIVKDGFQR